MTAKLNNFSAYQLYITFFLGVFTSLIAFVPSQVQAVAFISQRDALKSNDEVDWLSLGKVFNPRSRNPEDFLPNS